ncbi:MAG TPA: NADH-quinone oxidoreductase subunit M [Planctomycetota bacterium]|nr:NADH-quinone oxidoreductase subunit M [Planctomycetota bacterium]
MPSHLLSWIVFAPLIGAAAVISSPKRFQAWIKGLSLAATLAPLVLACLACCGTFSWASAEFQHAERIDWIRSIRAQYHVGVDGLSLALVALMSLSFFVAAVASSYAARASKAYFSLLLLLEVGVQGVFVSLDLFLLCAFWGLALVAMFFLIGVWGGAGREQAAMKFHGFTLAGLLLVLAAVIALRLDSGTFSAPTLIELARNGKLTGANLAGGGVLLGMNFSSWCFWCLFLGFAIQIPLVPLHSWLGDATAEAPAPVSICLAGILTKLGAFGLLRVCFPILPDSFRELSFALGAVGAAAILYGALVSLGQTDFRRLVASWTVSQMGFVLLGISAMTEAGVKGATLQLFSHGLSAAALLLTGGALFERMHRTAQGGSAARKISLVQVILAILGLCAAFGAPGFASFVSENSALAGAYQSSDPRFKILAWIGAAGAIIGLFLALSLVWRFLRLFLEMRKLPGARAAEPTSREMVCALFLVAACAALGLVPSLLLEPLGPSAAQLVMLLRGP